MPRYDTPILAADDVLVCREFAFTSDLWHIVFDHLMKLTRAGEWAENPDGMTIDETLIYIRDSIDQSVFRGCTMIGQIIELAVADPPEWALRCDGATYANVDYPELAAVIHPGLIVDDDNFRVPDRNRRLGMDGLDVGMTEGEEAHTLSVGELPAHHHGYTAPFGESLAVAPGEQPVVVASIGANTDDTGDGDAHNNMQPVEGTQFYIIARWPNA